MSEQENATAVAETTPPEETKESAKASKKKTAKPAKKKKVELPPPKKHGETFDVFLGSIVATDNPRQEPERLAQLGYSIISKDPDHSLITMALSDDIEVVRTLVNLFEEHESDEGTELDEEEGVLSKIAKRTNGLQQQQSIIALAKDLKLGQLQPILVRKLPSGYSLVAGQRRTAAVVYLHAKSVLEHHESAKVKIYEPVIEAKVGSFGNDEAFIVAIRENMNRKEFTPLQWGMIYRELTHKINPKTKKNYTVTDIANEFGQTYGNVRNRLSLTQKRQEAKVDDEGNVIKPGKGLTDEDREKLATGKMTLTAAIRKSLGERHFSADPKEKAERAQMGRRRRGIPLKEMQALFDNTAEDNIERRKAIAECMDLTLAAAEKESVERIDVQDAAEAKADLRKNKAKKGKGAA